MPVLTDDHGKGCKHAGAHLKNILKKASPKSFQEAKRRQNEDRILPRTGMKNYRGCPWSTGTHGMSAFAVSPTF